MKGTCVQMKGRWEEMNAHWNEHERIMKGKWIKMNTNERNMTGKWKEVNAQWKEDMHERISNMLISTKPWKAIGPPDSDNHNNSNYSKEFDGSSYLYIYIYTYTYIYIHNIYIHILYIYAMYIYIYTWLVFGAPSKRRNGSLLQDYLVSGAAGYVSFCQGAPDNVLDGTLAVSLEGTESCL